jgi:peptidyl-prolyl cis-trans isomerase SurA
MNTTYTMHQALPSARRITLAALLLCMALVAAPGARAQSTAAPQLADEIIAVVNNDVITRNELRSRQQEVEQRMRAQGMQLPSPELLRKQLLERMIVDRAQLQLAAEMGIRVDDQTLDLTIARIAEQNRMSVQQFRDQIERDGMSYARFREEIRKEILMQRVREREVDSKIQITESEVDNFLAAEEDAAQNQQEYRLGQILVRIPENASAEQIAERRRRAEQVLQQLRAGADFARIASTHSDASDALNGGDLGWRTPERLPQLFADAVASLRQGDVSDILRSANGFHILKVLGKRTPSVLRTDTDADAVQQTHARHILIKVNQVVTAADARRKLLDLKAQLDSGAAAFEELARRHSNDLSASKGGDLGWLYPGDTVPQFEQAMNALQPGQISEPVESPFGYHLIQVVERKMEDVSPERKRMIARQIIRERKLEEAAEDWLRQLRDRAYVEYRDNQ